MLPNHSLEPGIKLLSLFGFHSPITFSITAFHINDTWITKLDFSSSFRILGNIISILIPSFELGLSINKLHKDLMVLNFIILNSSRKLR